jgi:hypothetical protein
MADMSAAERQLINQLRGLWLSHNERLIFRRFFFAVIQGAPQLQAEAQGVNFVRIFVRSRYFFCFLLQLVKQAFRQLRKQVRSSSHDFSHLFPSFASFFRDRPMWPILGVAGLHGGLQGLGAGAGSELGAGDLFGLLIF